MDKSTLNSIHNSILVALAWAYGGLYAYELSNEVGIASHFVKCHLDYLISVGLVQAYTDGTYDLTPAGCEAVTDPLWKSMELP